MKPFWKRKPPTPLWKRRPHFWMPSVEAPVPFPSPPVEHVFVTDAELRAELDRLTRKDLGITGDDFCERLRSGELDEDDPQCYRAALLARLLDRAS